MAQYRGVAERERGGKQRENHDCETIDAAPVVPEIYAGRVLRPGLLVVASHLIQLSLVHTRLAMRTDRNPDNESRLGAQHGGLLQSRTPTTTRGFASPSSSHARTSFAEPAGRSVQRFSSETGRLVGVGTNGVVRLNNSSAHAEIVALAMAQAAVGSFTLAERRHASPRAVLVVRAVRNVPWRDAVERRDPPRVFGDRARTLRSRASTRGRSSPTRIAISRIAGSRSNAAACGARARLFSISTSSEAGRSTTRDPLSSRGERLLPPPPADLSEGVRVRMRFMTSVVAMIVATACTVSDDQEVAIGQDAAAQVEREAPMVTEPR